MHAHVCLREDRACVCVCVCVWDRQADVACLIKTTAGYRAHLLTLWAVCWNGWECIIVMSHNWASGLSESQACHFCMIFEHAHTHTHTHTNLIAFLHVWRAHLEVQMFTVMASGSLHVKHWPLAGIRTKQPCIFCFINIVRCKKGQIGFISRTGPLF